MEYWTSHPGSIYSSLKPTKTKAFKSFFVPFKFDILANVINKFREYIFHLRHYYKYEY